jgi:predicted O-linked N-acetylglucosamine transferase (SPINDLY family)
MRLRLKQAFNQFIDVSNMPEMEIAKLSRELKIDIAVDLGGHTLDSRTAIFSYRAAPIQVNWLGYPGTLGADYFDYIVADKTLIPESHQTFYSEKVAYLPYTYMVDDSKRVASSRVFTREECGLPENTFIFCCFNNSYKFNPQILDSWSRILKQVENSILWIPENSSIFKANIIIEFKNRGVDSRRVIFTQRLESMADHLARFTLADLFLDTHPYNAHTTAVDSLKAGVPVLTLIGQSFASRVAASLLNAIGLPELIASTQEEYEALAIELALNSKKLADIKLKLAKNRLSTPLFNTPLFTKNLEAAYVRMYERYQNGLEPSHFSVDSTTNHLLNSEDAK